MINDLIVVKVLAPDKPDDTVVKNLIESLVPLIEVYWVERCEKGTEQLQIDVEYLIQEWLSKRMTIMLVKDKENKAVGFALSQRMGEVFLGRRLHVVTNFMVSDATREKEVLEEVCRNVGAWFPQDEVALWLGLLMPEHAYNVKSSHAGRIVVV